MDTRERLIRQSTRQFAEKGFYGTSIASIAEAIGISKQALLHHFGSKEALYAAVLVRISDDALARCRSIDDEASTAEENLEAVIVDHYRNAMNKTAEAKLLMRELLDNEPRAAGSESWFLKSYLDGLVRTLRKVDGFSSYSSSQALVVVYQLLGAANYFCLSMPTLRKMYGAKNFDTAREAYENELVALVRARLDKGRP